MFLNHCSLLRLFFESEVLAFFVSGFLIHSQSMSQSIELHTHISMTACMCMCTHTHTHTHTHTRSYTDSSDKAVLIRFVNDTPTAREDTIYAEFTADPGVDQISCILLPRGFKPPRNC